MRLSRATGFIAIIMGGCGCGSLREGPQISSDAGRDDVVAIDAFVVADALTSEDRPLLDEPTPLDVPVLADAPSADVRRCSADQIVCGGSCVDPNTSVAHCGGCGRACPSGRVCAAGTCQLSCGVGVRDCGGTCRDLQRDVANCGACGQTCVIRNAVAACVAGACAVGTCDPGSADCDSNVSNGCECAPAHGVPSCPSGRCVVASCDAGYGDCDRDSTNGCEVDLRASAGSCGACGRTCTLPNAVSACASGNCAVARCTPGFGDCDRDPANGCEASLPGDARNCGACGRACSAAQYCASGSCAMLRCDPSEVLIPGGTFQMGSPVGVGYDVEWPQHSVTVSSFCLGRREVLTTEYAICHGAGGAGCTAPGTGAGCNGGVVGRERHPINCVDWNQASALCRWDSGGRLPTEGEWEYAARGPTNRTYPWGEAAPTNQLCWSGVASRSSTCPVETFPSGTFGLFDMAGNVYEWTADWFGPYTGAAAENPIGASSGTERVYRGGGAFDTGAIAQRSAFRSFRGAVNFRAANLGFRCVHAPQR